MAKRVLVSGAGGFIGRKIVEVLLEQGHEVVAFDVVPLSGPLFSKCRTVAGDIRQAKDVEEAAAGCEAFIHLAGALGFSDYQHNYDIHVTGTANVIEACRKQGVSHLLAYSTVAAAREHPGAYGETKKQAESLLLASALNVTIFRPTMVLGKGGKGTQAIVTQVRAYPLFIPLVGGGKANRQPVWLNDIAGVTVRTLWNPRSYGKVYDIAGEEKITFRELVQNAQRELGLHKKLLPIPSFIVKGMAYGMEKIKPKPTFTVENVRNITLDEEVDIKPAKDDLQFSPTPLPLVLRDVMKEYR